MCNEIARRIALGLIVDGFSELRIPLTFPEGRPNLADAPSIRITDPTLIVRRPADPARAADIVAEAVVRRWSWPGPTGRPVYNYRSEGRDFANGKRQGRCLIPIDGFYEFTTPPADAPIKSKRKDKWLFTRADAVGNGLLCVAGLWRAHDEVGEAFTLLTAEPGPDVAPYHHRQIVLIPPARWADWLSGEVAAGDLIAPSPGGVLSVARAG